MTRDPADNASGSSEHAASQSAKQLQSNALGLLATAALTAAYMGPALSVYALFGEMTNKVGMGIGFVMLLAMALTLCTAISFGMLAKEMPSAGGLYAWTRKSLGESAGVAIGVSSILYFAISLIYEPIIFGQFFNEMLEQCGIDTTSWQWLGIPGDTWTWMLGATLSIVAGAWVVYRGIVVSSHMTATLLLIELSVIAALAITFLVAAIQQGTFTLAPLTFSACTGDTPAEKWRWIFLALPMGLMCMVCDAAVPTAEETRNAKWTIPIAVVLTCFLIGVWYVFGFSCFAMARTAADVTDSPTQSLVAPMVKRVWGSFRVLVSITAMTAALGAFIPIMTASSRIIFAMGREHHLPKPLAKLHPRFRCPWNALHLLFAFTALSTIPAVVKFGANTTISWWSYILGWFIAVVYFTANVVNIVYYARFARERFNFFLNAFLPGLAMIFQIYFTWKLVVDELSEEPTGQGRIAQMAIVALSALTILYGIYEAKTRKKRAQLANATV